MILTAGQRWGRWHWVRVAGLRFCYFPFWRSVSAARRAYRAAFDPSICLVTCEELMNLTEQLDEHPEDWQHPCLCALCRSYGE